MNNRIGSRVKHVWNDGKHVLHNFIGFVLNSTAYHLGQFSCLHLLLLKSSIIRLKRLGDFWKNGAKTVAINAMKKGGKTSKVLSLDRMTFVVLTWRPFPAFSQRLIRRRRSFVWTMDKLILLMQIAKTSRVTRKIAKCLQKVPKNDFTRKRIDFDTFTKIA